MVCKKLYFLLIVTIMVFLFFTFAIWLFDDNIPQDDGISRCCKGWLEFYGFRDDNYVYMIHATIHRNYKLDKEISWIVAGYAYRLSIRSSSRNSNDNHVEISPSKFCQIIGTDETMFKFLALKDKTANNCEDFMYMYGYSSYDVSYNRIIAKSIRSSPYESMWAFMYRDYIRLHEEVDCTPSNFCAEIGKTETTSEMPMIFVGEILNVSCEEMIKQFDFNDDSQHNLKKAGKKYKGVLKPYIPFWVLKYVDDLLEGDDSEAKTIKDFCASWRNCSVSTHRKKKLMIVGV